MTPAEHNIRLLLAEMSLTEVIEQKLRHEFGTVRQLPRSAWYVLLDSFEMAVLKVVGEACHFNQVQMAEVLGLNRNTTRKKLANCGLIGAESVANGFAAPSPPHARHVLRDASDHTPRPADGFGQK